MADTDALLTAAETAVAAAQTALADLRAALVAPPPAPVPDPVPAPPAPVPPPPAAPVAPALPPPPDAVVATPAEAEALARTWAADWHGTGPDAPRSIAVTAPVGGPLDLAGVRVPKEVRIASAIPGGRATLAGLALSGAANLTVAGWTVDASIMILGDAANVAFEDVLGRGAPAPGSWGSTAPGSYGWMIDAPGGKRPTGIALRRCGAARYTGKAVLVRSADDVTIDGMVFAEGHSDDMHFKDVKRLRTRDAWFSRSTTAPAAEHLDCWQGTVLMGTALGGEDVTLEDSAILPRPVAGKPYMQGPFLDDAPFVRATIRRNLIMPNNLNGIVIMGSMALVEENFVGRQPGTVNINAKHSIIRTVGSGATVRRNVEARDFGAAVGGRALLHLGGNFGVYRSVFEAPTLFAAGTGFEEARPVPGGGMHWDDPIPDGCWRLLARVFRDGDHPGAWGTAAGDLWRADYDPKGLM